MSEILNNTRSLSHRIRDLESEVHYKSRSIKSINFDKMAEKKILEMIASGKYSEGEIVSYLIDFDMPESYARKLVEKHLENRNFSLSRNSANK